MRGFRALLLLPLSLFGCSEGEVSTTSPTGGDTYEVKKGGDSAGDIHHDTSRALRDLPPLAPGGVEHEKPNHKFVPPDGLADGIPDPVAQTSAQAAAIAATFNIEGIGVGLLTFAPDAAPPDTTGIVGSTQYVQWVNESIAVFDKSTGGLIFGPVAGNTLWQGF